MRERLVAMGLKTVGDIKNISNCNEIERADGVSIQKLTQIYNKALEAVDEDCPPDIDHRKEDNPYKSKYGDNWKKNMMKSITFSHCKCVTDYIHHLMTESERVMKGTIHEDSWMVLLLLQFSRTIYDYKIMI